MHQEYLPYQITFSTTAVAHNCSGDECSRCLEDRIASRCICSSEAILDLVATLDETGDQSLRCNLQSVLAAGALLAAANVQLWVHHVYGQDESERVRAIGCVNKIELLLGSWNTQWPVAERWSSTLASLRRLYERTYTAISETPDSTVVESTPPLLSETEAYENPYPQLTEGNGLPVLFEQMSDKVRFILLASLEDSAARERVLQSSMTSHVGQVGGYTFFPEELVPSFGEPDFSGDFANDLWFDQIYGIGDGASSVGM